MRTNPARDQARAPAHAAALTWASMAGERGARVLNAPAGLLMARDKLYLARLPSQVRPKTLVSAQPEQIEAFLDELGGSGVLKPLSGTHGRDVFLIREGDRSNLGQILDVLCRGGGYVMAQEYVPEASRGDVRLLLLRGELMEGPGGAAAVRRVPPQKGFRSNVHAGGRAEKVEITDAMREVVAAVGPQLRADGLFLVGLDLIGRLIVEVNAYSPGGLGDAGRFADTDFAGHVIKEALRPEHEA
jgi:glutathione synthase